MSDDEDDDYLSQIPSTSTANVNYVPVKKKQTTINIEREERERIKRVAEKQAKYNHVVLDESAEDLDQALSMIALLSFSF